jgi:hypothetical protein
MREPRVAPYVPNPERHAKAVVMDTVHSPTREFAVERRLAT